MSITGNTIFIPASTSGIGLALARALQAKGNTVIAGGRRGERLEQITAGHPGLDTVQVDTADSASIEAAAKHVLPRVGRVGRHMLSESIRLQLADTTVKVVELVPPSVRTALMPGQETNEVAVPLDEFITDVVGLLESRPDAKEIQVEQVRFLRYGEARGGYDQVVRALSASDPHGG